VACVLECDGCFLVYTVILAFTFELGFVDLQVLSVVWTITIIFGVDRDIGNPLVISRYSIL
jgi:hypothetical protein